MPVNDATDVLDAIANCALCCVAGIAGTTAEAERQAVRHDGGLMGAVPVAELFLRYARAKLPNLDQSDKGTVTIQQQVLGVEYWMNHHYGRTVNVIGSTDNPLQLGELQARMNLYPVGSQYIVLILNIDEDFGPAEGHWLVAQRTPGGYAYTDFQTDVGADMVRAMVRRTDRPGDRFGGPTRADGPREAFGDISRNTNRYMAISVGQPQQQQGSGSCCSCCCYITTAVCDAMGLPDDCHELTSLRQYRDQVLLTTAQGQREVAEYYAKAPAIVAALDQRPDAEAVYRMLYDQHIQPAVAAADAGDHEAVYRLFRDGVLCAMKIAFGA